MIKVLRKLRYYREGRVGLGGLRFPPSVLELITATSISNPEESLGIWVYDTVFYKECKVKLYIRYNEGK